MRRDCFRYDGEKSYEISFPLGGIGSGSIGLAGNGRLIDWEIFNRPNKGSVNELSHFAIKAEVDGIVIDARVMNGDLPPPYSGSFARQYNRGFGWGPNRSYLSSLPHFKNSSFYGCYPLASIEFKDEKFPGIVELKAFNPFIPLHEDDSSIPGAFFEIIIKNNFESEIDYTVAMSLGNPFDKKTGVSKFQLDGNVKQVFITSTKYKPTHPKFGDITVATDSDNYSYQEYWLRGRWFDNLTTFWKEFSKPGKLKNRQYSETNDSGDVYSGSDMSTLAAHFKVRPGEEESVRFVITWNVPNCYNYLNPEFAEEGLSAVQKMALGTDINTIVEEMDPRATVWKNYYAKLWGDSSASASYSLNNWSRLYNLTYKFCNALKNTAMPDSLVDAVTANLSILKSPTCWRLEEGQLYGWEGCNVTVGSCEGSCTHVWNYVYSTAFLFPRLERSMRDLEYKYNLWDDGMMSFRLQLPLGRDRWSFIPCVDGQFGTVMKVYRDWKISGDTNWLRKIWPGVKKSIEYAWNPLNKQQWDWNQDGVLEGSQHHTFDVELFGPNSWLTGYYLGALKAGYEMAKHLGEHYKAEEYLNLFIKGSNWVNENLFNGEYFHQKINMKDSSILDPYKDEMTLKGDPVKIAYWNTEKGELKYQIGEGCLIDQVIAQWHANLSGLGRIFDREKVVKSLASIFKYNHKKSMRDFFNPCRVFALNDEAATIICEWPKENTKPAVPLVYTEESFSGCEYAVASHMIQEGLVAEGYEIVESVRNRYDGFKRNPWNEIECGSNYARSMASYSLLLAVSGFTFDMVKRVVGFNPILQNGSFECFWCVHSAWGTFVCKNNKVRISVEYGELNIAMLYLGFVKAIENVEQNHKIVNFTYNDRMIQFASEVIISNNSPLFITYS